jgi:acetolactate synthase small subunit
MKIRSNKKSIRFDGVSNESQLDDISVTAGKAGCIIDVYKNSTIVIVEGHRKNLDKFIKLYNK